MSFPPTFPQVSRCARVLANGKRCDREIVRIEDPNGDFWPKWVFVVTLILFARRTLGRHGRRALPPPPPPPPPP